MYPEITDSSDKEEIGGGPHSLFQGPPYHNLETRPFARFPSQVHPNPAVSVGHFPFNERYVERERDSPLRPMPKKIPGIPLEENHFQEDHRIPPPRHRPATFMDEERRKPPPAKSTFSFNFGFENLDRPEERPPPRPSPNMFSDFEEPQDWNPFIAPPSHHERPAPSPRPHPIRHPEEEENEFIPPPIAGSVPISMPELMSIQDIKFQNEQRVKLEHERPSRPPRPHPVKESKPIDKEVRVIKSPSIAPQKLPEPTPKPFVTRTSSTTKRSIVDDNRTKGMVRPKFPKFKSRPKTKTRITNSNVPQIPGTARQPELSKLPKRNARYTRNHFTYNLYKHIPFILLRLSPVTFGSSDLYRTNY